MILYMPEPFEFGMGEKQPEEYFTLKLPSGGEIEVEPCGKNQVRVKRLNSTDPMDYINQKLQPGNVITLEADL